MTDRAAAPILLGFASELERLEQLALAYNAARQV